MVNNLLAINFVSPVMSYFLEMEPVNFGSYNPERGRGG